jgi:hypothetical protein
MERIKNKVLLSKWVLRVLLSVSTPDRQPAICKSSVKLKKAPTLGTLLAQDPAYVELRSTRTRKNPPCFIQSGSIHYRVLYQFSIKPYRTTTIKRATRAKKKNSTGEIVQRLKKMKGKEFYPLPLVYSVPPCLLHLRGGDNIQTVSLRPFARGRGKDTVHRVRNILPILALT